MFVDQVQVEVQAGKGGDGMVAFRREKLVPFGGPAGGDGGRGGSIILYVDEGLRTLMDFRYQRHFKAPAGGNGQGKSMYGRAAEDRRIAVPAGTTVTDADTGEVLGDLTAPGRVGRGKRRSRWTRQHFTLSRLKIPLRKLRKTVSPASTGLLSWN